MDENKDGKKKGDSKMGEVTEQAPQWFTRCATMQNAKLDRLPTKMDDMNDKIDEAKAKTAEFDDKVINLEAELGNVKLDIEDMVTQDSMSDMMQDMLKEKMKEEGMKEMISSGLEEMVKKDGAPRVGGKRASSGAQRTTAKKSEEALERTVVVGGFERDSLGTEITDGIKAGHGDSDGNVEDSEEIFVRGRRSSIGFIRFKDAQGKKDFLTNLKNKGEVTVNGRRMWANDDKDEATRLKEKSAAKMVKVLKEFKVAVDGITDLKLGFTGVDILKVFAEHQFEVARCSRDDFAKLGLFKLAVKKAVKFTKARIRNAPASTTEEKLSACVGFLRALDRIDWKNAGRIQASCPRLRGAPVDQGAAATRAYRDLLAHVQELGHVSVKERVDELKRVRKGMPEIVYKQRKDGILSSLRRLLPGATCGLSAVRDRSGGIASEPEALATALTPYWQTAFDHKPTGSSLRRQWLDQQSDKLRVDSSDLCPTLEDVRNICELLPKSSSGPDGIHVGVYGRFADILAPVFFEIVTGMIQGAIAPPCDFNWAFLICLPKGRGDLHGGTEVHDPAGARPLSIVDASNRIIASIFRVALERKVAEWVSAPQRGFLVGRQMLRNAVDVDFAAQKISISSRKGAIVPFDFKAAFPSLSHDYMRGALEAIGLPPRHIDALRMFYKDNKRWAATDRGTPLPAAGAVSSIPNMVEWVGDRAQDAPYGGQRMVRDLRARVHRGADIIRMSSGVYALFRAVSGGGVQASAAKNARALLYLWRCRAGE
ncbi:unnamed protein product [Prorocentrum cordatum]|uniref:Reverse transcriptase domain-containing protein n=1 Tax=Prorocentrum cordatum TaxID=2364126 RepID=A0ABN9XTG7_9DINO|nr:unnamed protein product [Polarella glacialis]